MGEGIQSPGVMSYKIQALIIGLLAIIFYGNTYNNEYALDDEVVIVRNAYVLEGFKGIPDIITHDAYESYFERLGTSDHLTGGRYRPLSIVTFAIEQQLFGAVPGDKADSVANYNMSYGMDEPYERMFLQQMHIRHLVNVFLFALSVIVLLYFLRFVVFRQSPLAAFIAALIFTIHPIHTEVVANVKSRDEIMSLLFICLTFIFAFKYQEEKKIKLLIAALVSYFLAFLCKEYAITLLFLLPLSFYLFSGKRAMGSLLATVPYLLVAVLYMFCRFSVVGLGDGAVINDIQVNPYAFASPAQKLATEIATSLNYLKLLLAPHPLSSDYSYNQIPYKDFSGAVVWIAILFYLSLAAGFFYFLKRRNVLSFAIAFYSCNLLMVCNIVFDIGATMGERLIYHASVGFAVAAAYFVCKGFERIAVPKRRAWVLGVFILLVVLPSGYETTARNKDWKNNETLYFKDIQASPNSFLLNTNVAALLVNRTDYEKDDQLRVSDLRRAIGLLNKVLGLQDTYILGYMNRGIAYYKLGDADSLMNDLDKVRSMYPAYPMLPEMYYRASGMYYDHKNFEKARSAMQVVLLMHPGDPAALKAMQTLDTAGSAKH
jgi:tetratricopeptide (TPR) repeat protein